MKRIPHALLKKIDVLGIDSAKILENVFKDAALDEFERILRRDDSRRFMQLRQQGIKPANLSVFFDVAVRNNKPAIVKAMLDAGHRYSDIALAGKISKHKAWDVFHALEDNHLAGIGFGLD